ncbi:hypothetical protein [Flavobacterium sp. JP2137]|uniref:hypothetical protein n=1 Tax=Flavobacterium sp. JP2137 TaxID=3414510 RepID=UPI003D30081E
MEWINLLEIVVKTPGLHARFLNTLSFMENAGARKISSCEDPQTVSLLQLKHAAEEHRHAYYLKKQIQKIDPLACPTFEAAELLAAVPTQQYLNRLDLKACRLLKKHFGLSGAALKFAAYLFVTYAIEVRADELYPVYQQVLTAQHSRVMVRSIILEEAGHLEEMLTQLRAFSDDWEAIAQAVVAMENDLHTQWFNALVKEVV